MMNSKLRPWMLGVIVLGVAVISGAMGAAIGGNRFGQFAGEEPLMEGDLMWVHYRKSDKEEMAYSLTKHVPGGNGSHSIHLYARLYRDYLVLTNPERTEWGPHVIPASQLIELEFTTAENARQLVDAIRRPAPKPDDGHNHAAH